MIGRSLRPSRSIALSGSGAGGVEAGDQVGVAESVENVSVEIEDVGPGAAVGETDFFKSGFASTNPEPRKEVVRVKGAAGESGFHQRRGIQPIPIERAGEFLHALALFQL